MSSKNKSSKRVVKTIKSKDQSSKKPRATRSRSQRSSESVGAIPLIFNKQNYLFMGLGVLLMALGFILMSGGGSDDPNVFDAERIYSFRRITLAPFIIILGLLVEVYAIFKK